MTRRIDCRFILRDLHELDHLAMAWCRLFIGNNAESLDVEARMVR